MKERPWPPAQHRMTMARMIKKKVAKKFKKKGLPRWLDEQAVLSQYPLDTITAFHVQMPDLRNRDDLSEAE